MATSDTFIPNNQAYELIRDNTISFSGTDDGYDLRIDYNNESQNSVNTEILHFNEKLEPTGEMTIIEDGIETVETQSLNELESRYQFEPFGDGISVQINMNDGSYATISFVDEQQVGISAQDIDGKMFARIDDDGHFHYAIDNRYQDKNGYEFGNVTRYDENGEVEYRYDSFVRTEIETTFHENGSTTIVYETDLFNLDIKIECDKDGNEIERIAFDRTVGEERPIEHDVLSWNEDHFDVNWDVIKETYSNWDDKISYDSEDVEMDEDPYAEIEEDPYADMDEDTIDIDDYDDADYDYDPIE